MFFHLTSEAEELLRKLKVAQDQFIEIDYAGNDMDNASVSLESQISCLSENFVFLCDTARLILRLIECSRCITEQCIGGLLVTYPKGDGPVALPVSNVSNISSNLV